MREQNAVRLGNLLADEPSALQMASMMVLAADGMLVNLADTRRIMRWAPIRESALLPDQRLLTPRPG